MVSYVALRFAEDANIADRVYWYRCAFPVNVGEQVFAPVGSHDRIQRAQVERTSAAPPQGLYYLKSVAAKCGAFRRMCADTVVFETGGLSYDAKHFTRFGRVLFGDCAELVAGVTPVGADSARRALARLPTEGCVLLTGREAALAAAVLMRAAGAKEADVCARLAACGCSAAGAAETLSELSGEERARLAGILQ